MSTDLYTKSVLTVIALCLVWMCLNGVTPVTQAQAQAQPQAKSAPPAPPTPVVLVNEKGIPIYTSQGLRVSLVNEQGTPVYTPQGLRVNVAGEPVPVVVNNPVLPVSVRAIQQGNTWDPILVQLLRDPPTLKPTP
jgi:hypothetical protein